MVVECLTFENCGMSFERWVGGEGKGFSLLESVSSPKTPFSFPPLLDAPNTLWFKSATRIESNELLLYLSLNPLKRVFVEGRFCSI